MGKVKQTNGLSVSVSCWKEREGENSPLEKFMNAIKLFTSVQIRYNNLFYEKII